MAKEVTTNFLNSFVEHSLTTIDRVFINKFPEICSDQNLKVTMDHNLCGYLTGPVCSDQNLKATMGHILHGCPMKPIYSGQNLKAIMDHTMDAQ